MAYIKSTGKVLGFSFLIILAFTFFITILSYFDLLNYKVINILKLLTVIISLFVSGLIVGKKSLAKGWLEGLKFAGIFVVLIVIFNYLGVRQEFDTNDLIYYIILLVTGIFGSVVGINLKKS